MSGEQLDLDRTIQDCHRIDTEKAPGLCAAVPETDLSARPTPSFAAWPRTERAEHVQRLGQVDERCSEAPAGSSLAPCLPCPPTVEGRRVRDNSPLPLHESRCWGKTGHPTDDSRKSSSTQLGHRSQAAACCGSAAADPGSPADGGVEVVASATLLQTPGVRPTRMKAVWTGYSTSGPCPFYLPALTGCSG